MKNIQNRKYESEVKMPNKLEGIVRWNLLATTIMVLILAPIGIIKGEFGGNLFVRFLIAGFVIFACAVTIPFILKGPKSPPTPSPAQQPE